jgi:hypothetical protein
VARIDLRPDQVEIHLLPERLGNLLAGDASLLSPASAAAEDAPRLTLCAPARPRRAGMEMTMLIDAKQGRKGKPDPSLVKLIFLQIPYSAEQGIFLTLSGNSREISGNR